MTVRSAIFRQAVCTSDVINKAGVCRKNIKSHQITFSAFHWWRVNQQLNKAMRWKASKAKMYFLYTYT